MKKIYCFIQEWVDLGHTKDAVVYAVSEDGDFLSSHICSNEGWAKMDIQNEYHKGKYKAHYPDGYEIVWIDDAANSPIQQKLLQLNKEKYAK